MKTILFLIFAAFLLTSCSNPDTSGGVTLSKGGGGDHHNNFPYGSCRGSDQFGHNQRKTGCGWLTANNNAVYYIAPKVDMSDALLGDRDLSGANLSGATLINADLSGANLTSADLSGANLSLATLNEADLSGADVSGVIANRYTSCPNGIIWDSTWADCGF